MTYETNHENYSSANNLNKTKHSSSKTLDLNEVELELFFKKYKGDDF